ncbi:MAG: diguanylate cyclase [Actinomycetota bacterium]
MGADSSPDFHRAVLDRSPMPLVVVDEAGLVVYGNLAMVELTGMSLEEARGTSMLDRVHPDDRDWVTEAFIELVSGGAAGHFDQGSAWATLLFRMIDGNGRAVPIEVTGSGGVLDPEVGGVIYDVRPAWAQDLLGRILEGLATGAPLDELLRLIVMMAAVPPLEFDAAVLRRDDRTGRHRVVATSHPSFVAPLAALSGPVPWDRDVAQPTRHDPRTIGPGAPLATAGYCDVWHVGAGDAEHGGHSFVAGTRLLDATAVGAVNRLHRARQLASVVLQRARADEELARAALRDPLTGVLNRLGLVEGALVRCEGPGACAAIYLDLDGFKPVNDRYGHAFGDDVLHAVAGRLRSATRSDDLVGRVGGDEFVIVPAAGVDLAAAEASARTSAARVLEVLGRPIIVDRIAVDVGASIGLAVAPTPASLDDLLAAADRQMYEAKRAGGGTVRPEPR